MANDGVMTAWVKALAILAWADGNLDSKEIKRLSIDAVAFAGMDLGSIEKLFDDARAWARDLAIVAREIEPIRGSDLAQGLTHLKRCYDLAMSDGVEDPTEVKVIEQLAALFVPADRVSKVVPWLRATRQAALLEAELLPKGRPLPGR